MFKSVKLRTAMTALIAFVLTLVMSVSAFGGVLQLLAFNELYLNPAKAELLEGVFITGGIIKDAPAYNESSSVPLIQYIEKNTEVTFDSMRNIIGSAPRETKITVSSFKYDDINAEFLLVHSNTVSVGASGMFSCELPLELSDNYILITAQKDDRLFCKTTLITRKAVDIKRELEQGIALPGQSTIVKKVNNE